MQLKTKALRGEWKDARTTLTVADLTLLKKALSAIDWKTVKKDRVKGLDGRGVFLSVSKEQEKSIWSPEIRTTERKLDTFLKAVETLLRLGGSGPDGMPAK